MEIALPPRVLGVLEVLLNRAGDVVPRQELIDTVWKEAFVTDTSLAEAVSYLRQALGDDSQAPRYIQTIHRRGYRFVAPVSNATAPPNSAVLEGAVVQQPRPIEPAHEPVRPSIGNELVPWSIAILSFVAALSALWYATNQKPAKLPILTLPIELGTGEQFDTRAPALAISPSGSMVAWSACRNGRCQLYIRDLQNLGTNRVLVGTDGAAAPFFSPDELWLGYFAEGKLKKVFVRGGGASTITEAARPLGGTWLDDGTIVFASSEAAGLMRVNQNGGTAEPLTRPSAENGEMGHAYPSRTPDGNGVLFVIRTSPLPSAPGRLALLPNVRSSQPAWKILVDGVDNGGAVGTEFLAFIRQGSLDAVAYDWLRQTPAGVPQVVQSRALSPHLALSPSGAMASVMTSNVELSTRVPPVWTWTTGASITAADIPPLYQAALSPDGRRVAGIDVDSLSNVWTSDLERGTRTRLTYTSLNAHPVWTADGQRVFYGSRRQHGFEIWARASTGTGDEVRILAKDGRHLFPFSVSAQGDIAMVETGGPSKADVALLRPGARDAQMIAQTPFDETAPAISPDGTLLAYQSDESGRWEITLVRLSDGARHVVSRDGGSRPFWSPDGRTLYFEEQTALMGMSVDPQRGEASAPTPVSSLHDQEAVGVSRSGAVLLQRIGDPSVRTDIGGLTVNWIEHLRRTLVPPLPSIPR